MLQYSLQETVIKKEYHPPTPEFLTSTNFEFGEKKKFIKIYWKLLKCIKLYHTTDLAVNTLKVLVFLQCSEWYQKNCRSDKPSFWLIQFYLSTFWWEVFKICLHNIFSSVINSCLNKKIISAQYSDRYSICLIIGIIVTNSLLISYFIITSSVKTLSCQAVSCWLTI